MFSSKLLKASVATLALMALSSPALSVGEEIGVNSAVKGEITIKSAEEEARSAVVKDPVLLGDEINSKLDSSLQVLLKDQTVFTVGPDCELTIDKFVYDPTKSNNGMGATVAKGMFRFMSGNISKSGADSVSIDTPVASMGIRGTIVEGLVGPFAVEIARRLGLITPGMAIDDIGATLFVLRGPGQATVANNKTGEIDVTSGGQTVTLRQAGTAVFIPNKNSPPIGPFVLTDDEFEEFNRGLRTRPTGGPGFQPFPLDPFIEIGPDNPGRKPKDPNTSEDFNPDEDGEYNDDTIFDWPTDIEGILTGPDGNPCTPNSPDYPSCLL
jgi:hypothetical protein